MKSSLVPVQLDTNYSFGQDMRVVCFWQFPLT
jgi:hypothetical protein